METSLPPTDTANAGSGLSPLSSLHCLTHKSFQDGIGGADIFEDTLCFWPSDDRASTNFNEGHGATEETIAPPERLRRWAAGVGWRGRNSPAKSIAHVWFMLAVVSGGGCSIFETRLSSPFVRHKIASATQVLQLKDSSAL